MSLTVRAGRYTLTFKTANDFFTFRRRTLLFMEALPDLEAHSAVSRMAWRYYARCVTYNGVELSDVNPVPYGLWLWMRQNWDMDMMEEAV